APLVTSGGGVVSGTWADRWTVGLADRRAAKTAPHGTAHLIAPPSRSASPAPRAPCTDARPARAARRPRAAAAVRRVPLWPPRASETGRPPASFGASRASRAAPPRGTGAARRAARDIRPSGRRPAARRGRPDNSHRPSRHCTPPPPP